MQQQSPETSGALCKARPMDGLTPQEAAARAAAGLANEAPKPLTKTAGRIVRDNLCTFFNFVFWRWPPVVWPWAHTATRCFLALW